MLGKTCISGAFNLNEQRGGGQTEGRSYVQGLMDQEDSGGRIKAGRGDHSFACNWICCEQVAGNLRTELMM